MTTGICFGGYCPMHRGHLDAIMRAKKENDRCLVIVCGYDGEQRSLELGIPLTKRFQLVKEFFRDDEQISVITINDSDLGLDESMSLENWKVWTDHIWNATHIDPNASTFYVNEWSYKTYLENSGCKAVYLEKLIPISGTLIRKNPYRYWDYIVDAFHPYLAKKILITGTASEGKTTLVRDITRYFGITGTVEYGREYMKRRNMTDVDLSLFDFKEFIVQQYESFMSALFSPCNKGVVVADTDSIVTLMYAKAYSEMKGMGVTEKDYDVLEDMSKAFLIGWDRIFIFPPHNAFVDDGTRYMEQSSMVERKKNYDTLTSLYRKFGYEGVVEMTELNGTYYDNFLAVKECIEG